MRTSTAEKVDTEHVRAVPSSDEASAILVEALTLVPVSSWTFARIDSRGLPIAPYGSIAEDRAFAVLATEYKLQCSKISIGSRLAATMSRFERGESGIMLIFGDARARSAVLLLLRDAQLGPFTSMEISLLAFTLAAISDRLAALRLQPSEKADDAVALVPRVVQPERVQAFYLLDADFRIVLEWSSVDGRSAAAGSGLDLHFAERLPPPIEKAVREMTVSWVDEETSRIGTMRPVKFLLLRVQPVTGPLGRFIGVRIERYVTRNSLTAAALRFGISPRETQVLAQLLDGQHLEEIAGTLNITSSTVQDHIKNLLAKTASLSRSELIARILGWESIPRAQSI